MQQAVARIDLDAESGAVGVRVDDAVEGAVELGEDVDIARDGDVASDGMDEPQRAVRGVVLEPSASAVFASIPSESVAADRARRSRPSSKRLVLRNRPSYDVIVSRDHSPNHG